MVEFMKKNEFEGLPYCKQELLIIINKRIILRTKLINTNSLKYRCRTFSVS